MQVYKSKFPVQAWVDHVPVDSKAIDQLKNTASLPFIFKWVAAMKSRGRLCSEPQPSLNCPRKREQLWGFRRKANVMAQPTQ